MHEGSAHTADSNKPQAQPKPGADDCNPPCPRRPGSERRSQLDLQAPVNADGQQDVKGNCDSKQEHPARMAELIQK